MSGHNKFSNIKHKKEANDAAKGKIFTKMGREIAVAVKEGGPDVNNNSKLKDIVAKAKAANMPNDTIERSIKKAAGEGANVDYEAVTYEGHGPAGVSIIVEGLTDNRNRTASDVKAAFSKGDGSLGTPGSCSFMFDEKGVIIIDKEECELEEDDLTMIALDAGADDFIAEDEDYVIYTTPDGFHEVREKLEAEGIPMLDADVKMVPQNYVDVTDPEAVKKIRRILALLEESDDVQNVYTNWNEPDDDEE